jgi:hypothetical protein
MLCFFGTKARPFSTDPAFQIATALKKAEVPGRVERIMGAGHRWIGRELTRTLNASSAFVDERLKK